MSGPVHDPGATAGTLVEPAGPLPADAVRERLAVQNWTAHNLELAPGVWTLPGGPDFLTTNLHLLSMVRFLRTLWGADLSGLRVADLGCLEGGFALAFARLGAEVVGVEVRPENMEKCRLVRQQAGLPNLRFEQADVKDFTVDRFGRFDVVLAMGILYHLDDPAAWLRQTSRATAGVLYLDTHFAPPAGADLAALDPRLRSLGPLEQRAFPARRLEGRWFREHTTPGDREAMPWSSYSNPDSFWLTKRSLLTVLVGSGFDLVLEQHEHWADLYEHQQTAYPRCFLAAVRSAAARAIAERGRPVAR